MESPGTARGKEKEKNPLEHAVYRGDDDSCAAVWPVQSTVWQCVSHHFQFDSRLFVPGSAVSLVYFLFEGEIFRLLLRSQGYRISVGQGLKNALLGLYYSYITPSSTGGQPMQAAYLLRDDKIPVGISTAALIIKFMCFQCAFVLVSVVSFVGMYGNLSANNPGIIPFIVLGLIINGCSILFFASLFYKQVLHVLCRFAKWLVGRFSFLRKRTGLLDSIDRFEADFSSYTDDFQGKQKSLIAGVLLSIPQFILQMSVIYFIFRAFGYHNVSYLEIVAVQSLLQVSVSFMPMPGASGAQEIGFSSFFRNYFVNDDLYAAVMVWRFFTYYLVVIAGALLVVIDQFWYRKKKLREALSVPCYEAGKESPGDEANTTQKEDVLRGD